MTLPVFVGIDVAKATLEVAERPSGECWQLANEEPAILLLVTRLQALGPTLVAPRHVLSVTWAPSSPPGGTR